MKFQGQTVTGNMRQIIDAFEEGRVRAIAVTYVDEQGASCEVIAGYDYTVAMAADLLATALLLEVAERDD